MKSFVFNISLCTSTHLQNNRNYIKKYIDLARFCHLFNIWADFKEADKKNGHTNQEPEPLKPKSEKKLLIDWTNSFVVFRKNCLQIAIACLRSCEYINITLPLIFDVFVVISNQLLLHYGIALSEIRNKLFKKVDCAYMATVHT